MGYFHGFTRLFAQLDRDRSYRPVRHAPLRAYAGWWDEMQADEVPKTPWWKDPEIEHAKECRYCGGEIKGSVADKKPREFCSGPCYRYYQEWVERGRPSEQEPCVMCGQPNPRWGEETCSPECKMEMTVQARHGVTPEIYRKRQRRWHSGQKRMVQSLEAAREEAEARRLKEQEEENQRYLKDFQAKWATLDAIPMGSSIVTSIGFAVVHSWILHGNPAKAYNVGPGLLLVVRDLPQNMPDRLP